MSGNLLEVRNLKVQFPLDGGRIRKAVNDVSFAVERGSVTCLVGESGSGKSVTALSIIDLVPRPGTITGGEVLFEGHDVLSMKRKDLERLRGSDISIIFQEPMHAMDPVRRIGDQIVETILVHSPADHPVDKREAWKQARAWIERVELADPDKILDSYPHELSGGMLQRVMIAIALCCHPKLLIADEPPTALDVTIQAQILALLMSLKDESGLSCCSSPMISAWSRRSPTRWRSCMPGVCWKPVTCMTCSTIPRTRTRPGCSRPDRSSDGVSSGCIRCTTSSPTRMS